VSGSSRPDRIAFKYYGFRAAGYHAKRNNNDDTDEERGHAKRRKARLAAR
jgi:hypothetical protein